jgi:hypothetical protein
MEDENEGRKRKRDFEKTDGDNKKGRERKAT